MIKENRRRNNKIQYKYNVDFRMHMYKLFPYKYEYYMFVMYVF